MKRLKELIKGLIPRLLIIGLEVGAIFVFCAVFKTTLPENPQYNAFDWIFYFIFEDISRLFVMILLAYFFAGIAIIISWIFNFATDFDDYDSFASRFKDLLIAPLALIIRIFTHVKLTLIFFVDVLFNTDFSEKRFNKVTPTSDSLEYDSDGKKQNIDFSKLEKLMKQAINNTKPAAVNGIIYTSWFYGPYCRLYSFPFFTFEFKGTIEFYNPSSFFKLSSSDISECIEKTTEEIARIADEVLAKYYSGNTTHKYSFKYSFDMSYKIRET